MDYSSMEEGLGFAIRCVRCGSPVTPGSTRGEATCDNCGFSYDVDRRYLKYDCDELLFNNHRKEYFLYKVLNNNGYISYQSLQEGSLSLPSRKDVQRFRDFIWKNARKGRLLDIGCGPLELPGYLDFDGKKGFDFFGLDPIDNQKFVGVRIVGCAEYLPFGDGFFDTIIFATSLDHVCSLEGTIREVKRVLADEGKVIIWMSDRRRTILQKTWDFAMKIKTFKTYGCNPFRYQVYPNHTVLYIPRGAVDPFHSHMESPVKIKRMFEKQGFITEAIEENTKDEVFLSFAIKI